MFKEIGKFIKSIFRALSTAAQAVDNTAGAVNELAYAGKQSTAVVCDNIIEDLKIDAQVDAAKRERRLARAQAKTIRIKAEAEAITKAAVAKAKAK